MIWLRLIFLSLLSVCGHTVLATAKTATSDSIPKRFVQEFSGDQACLVCHGLRNIVIDQGSGEERSLWVDRDLFEQSVHSSLGCTACHISGGESGHKLAPSFGAHGEKGKISLGASPALAFVAGDSLLISEALKACINCHPNEYLEYSSSIHGIDVMSNLEKDSPYCINCHGSHYIFRSSDERALTNPKNVPHTCLKCHAEATIQQRFNLRKDVGGTFEDSFHGMRGELGGVAAICTSCHGFHEVYAASDGRSKVNALQISNTCGECHEGAQLNFASAFTHKQINRTEQLGLYILKQIYMWLIVGVIGVFLVIIILDRYQDYRHLKQRQSGDGMAQPLRKAGMKTFERFNLQHRIQHFLLALSFSGLVLSGWPLLYPKLKAVHVLCSVVGGVEVVGVIHRSFAVLLVFVSIYHITYLLAMYARGHRSTAMIPGKEDFKDAFADIKYFAGLTQKRPRFERYNWIEKFEYFAVVWGTFVMILTGLIIWFPQYATTNFPAWVVNAAVIIHDYEALLAGLTVFIWHFYWVHLNPSVYPMSLVWLTGEQTEEEMKLHHSKEYEKLVNNQATEAGIGDNEEQP